MYFWATLSQLWATLGYGSLFLLGLLGFSGRFYDGLRVLEGLRVRGLGIGFWGSRFRVGALGLRVQGSGIRLLGGAHAHFGDRVWVLSERKCWQKWL